MGLNKVSVFDESDYKLIVTLT